MPTLNNVERNPWSARDAVELWPTEWGKPEWAPAADRRVRPMQLERARPLVPQGLASARDFGSAPAGPPPVHGFCFETSWRAHGSILAGGPLLPQRPAGAAHELEESALAERRVPIRHPAAPSFTTGRHRFSPRPLAARAGAIRIIPSAKPSAHHLLEASSSEVLLSEPWIPGEDGRTPLAARNRVPNQPAPARMPWGPRKSAGGPTWDTALPERLRVASLIDSGHSAVRPLRARITVFGGLPAWNPSPPPPPHPLTSSVARAPLTRREAVDCELWRLLRPRVAQVTPARAGR